VEGHRHHRDDGQNQSQSNPVRGLVLHHHQYQEKAPPWLRRGCFRAKGGMGDCSNLVLQVGRPKSVPKKSGKSRPPVTKKRPRQSGGAISEQAPGGWSLLVPHRQVARSKTVPRKLDLRPLRPEQSAPPVTPSCSRKARALHSYRLDLNQLLFRNEVMVMRLRPFLRITGRLMMRLHSLLMRV
jgi:hypothetical protein